MKRILTVILIMACAAALTGCGAEDASPARETGGDVSYASVVRAEWSLEEAAELGGIVSGITDREYAAGEGANYVIHEDIKYDHDIVRTVLLNTAAVRFDVPGAYGMTYWIYFDVAALNARADANGQETGIPDADVFAVTVYATVTVTGAAEEEEAGMEEEAGIEEEAGTEEEAGQKEDGGNAEPVTAGTESGGTSGGSTAKGGSSTCSHDWVATEHEATGHYENVLVTAAYDEKVATGEYVYRCTKCGFETPSGKEIAGHNSVDGGSSTSVPVYETVHHDAVYEKQWVQDAAAYTSYRCGKCGAAK